MPTCDSLIVVPPTALGIAPPLCLALSLAKRGRELIVGLPALAAWAWLEGRNTRA